MSPRIPIAGGWGARRIGRAEERIREIQKAGPGMWVYVGTYPSDSLTTYWSPPWENSFDSVEGERVAFRYDVQGTLEFKGRFDLTSGAVSGTVAFTLPADWRGEALDFPIILDYGDGTFNTVRVVVDPDTGEVTLYWPLTTT